MSEHIEQVKVFEWLLTEGIQLEPLVHPLVFSTVNGVKLEGSPLTRKDFINRLKDEGFVPGVVDIICLIPKHGYHYMVVEMKQPIERFSEDDGVSIGQKEFMSAVSQVWGLDMVCYGAEEAIKLFEWYLTEDPEEQGSSSDGI